MRVDYLIIGAGLAGLTLRRTLDRRKEAVVLDPNPGNWKIGEANVPELFGTPILHELVDKVRQLPSFAQKNGSVFVGDDSIAVLPIVSNFHEAIHVARDELEQLMIAEWQIPIVRETVISIDVEAKVVRTEKTTYEVREQIIDCSGPAMLVASTLNDVRQLWPTWSTWRYYDVTGVDPAAFWRDAQEKNRSALFIDVPRIRIIDDYAKDAWLPQQATNLTKVEDGIWMWQIPMFGARRLSVGLVSRHGEVTVDALDAAVARCHARSYQLAPRPLSGESVYDRVHSRAGFARRAGRAATLNYILIGDAFMFVDPIYSVGTGIAVNKAIEIGVLLNHGRWNAETCKAFCHRYETLIERRTAAFEFWYSEETRAKDPNTARVQHYFPQMTSFQAGVAWQYSQVTMATLQLTRIVQAALEAYGASPSR